MNAAQAGGRLSRSIAGKVAIITGAASGMGRATAILFATEGALVGVLDRDTFHTASYLNGAVIPVDGGMTANAR